MKTIVLWNPKPCPFCCPSKKISSSYWACLNFFQRRLPGRQNSITRHIPQHITGFGCLLVGRFRSGSSGEAGGSFASSTFDSASSTRYVSLNGSECPLRSGTGPGRTCYHPTEKASHPTGSNPKYIIEVFNLFLIYLINFFLGECVLV